MQNKFLAAILFTLGSSVSMADVGAGLQIGSTGYGFDAAYKINSFMTARAGYSELDYTRKASYGYVAYEAKADIKSYRVLADIGLPYNFRISGGFVFLENRINITGLPSDSSYNINGHIYQASEVGSLTGQIKWAKKPDPYLGIGYGSITGKGLGFYTDLGAIYMGKAKTTQKVTCGSSLSAFDCATLHDNVDMQAQEVQDKASKYKWYPVISMGLSYGF